MTRFVSLFSGVGGFDLGLEAAGWRCVAQVEWDRACQRVLRRHWPDVPKWGDVQEVNGADLPEAEAIVFGSPCQDLSVAGKRAGLAGERSGLFHEALRIIHEVRDAESAPVLRWIVWENVPGALSSNRGRDFGAVLDAMGELRPLDVSWRVLDAQYFGVAQRRRRVFVVVDLGGFAAGAIHAEPESVRRDPPSSDPTREDIAGTLGGGTSGGGPKVDTDRMTFVPVTVGTLTPGAHPGSYNGQDAYNDLLIPAAIPIQDGRAMEKQQGGLGIGSAGAPSYTLDTTGGQAVAVNVFVKAGRATSVDTPETWTGAGVAPTLNAFDNGGDARTTVAALVATGVRRLTPRECERLQGWPDDHTRWRDDGTEQSDSARYRQIGNGVAAPVARWIAERLCSASRVADD